MGKNFIDCVSREESIEYFEKTIIGVESYHKEVSIEPDYSKYLYSSAEQRNKSKVLKQEDLIVSSRKDIQYSTKNPKLIPYMNIGLASAELKFENPWKEYFDPNWQKSLSYLKYSFCDFG